MSHFVIPDTLCNNSLLKFVMSDAFVIWQNTSYELRVARQELGVTSWKLKNTSWMFKSTIWNFKSVSSNPRVTSSNLRVPSSNPRIIKSIKTQVNNFKSCLFPKIRSPKLFGNLWGNWYVQFLMIISCFKFPLHHSYSFRRKLSD